MNSFFCSWSGGKDSCFALYYAINNGLEPGKLLTMMTDDKISRSHGLTIEVLKSQAASLNIPLITCPTTWDNYEENFIYMLKHIKKEGIHNGVFGDIDIQEHREWVTGVCSKVNMKAFLPLWNRSRKELVEDFINKGFKAIIVAINEKVMGREYLGKVLSEKSVNKFVEIGIDPSGENGEYHTVVIDGPIFTFPLNIEMGNIVSHNGYCFQKASIT